VGLRDRLGNGTESGANGKGNGASPPLLDRPPRLHYRPAAVIARLAFPFAPLLLLLSAPALAQEMAQATDDELVPGAAFGDDGGGVETPSEPPRVVVEVGGGLSLRIVQNIDYAQERAAPGFVDVFGAFVFGTGSVLRHGVGLSMSLNVSGDGSVDVGVDPGQQFVLGPAYLAYLRFDPDLVLTGKVLALFAVTPGLAPGVELALGGSYLVTAGLGPYVELSTSLYLGEANTVHPIASAEIGLFVDYEVLP